jgi:hypothetical protein
MIRKRFGVACLVLLAWGTLLAAPLRAQDSINNGTIEASVSVGASGGLGSVDKFTDIPALILDLTDVSGGPVTFDPGSKSKWNIGIAGGYQIRESFMVVGEIVKTRLANPTLTFSTLPAALDFKAGLLEMTGGIQYQIPLRYSRVAPFVEAAIGAARSSISIKDSPFSILDLNFSNYHLTENFGVGARIYISDKWGVRPEIKVVHIPNETWVRFAGGIFFQFNR